MRQVAVIGSIGVELASPPPSRALGPSVIALRSWTLNGRERMADAPGVIPADSAREAVELALAAL